MSKRRLLSSIIAMSMLGGMSEYSMWSEYSRPRRTHCNSETKTPSSEGHKEPTYRIKDKEHRKQIRNKRNARRRRSRR